MSEWKSHLITEKNIDIVWANKTIWWGFELGIRRAWEWKKWRLRIVPIIKPPDLQNYLLTVTGSVFAEIDDLQKPAYKVFLNWWETETT